MYTSRLAHARTFFQKFSRGERGPGGPPRRPPRRIGRRGRRSGLPPKQLGELILQFADHRLRVPWSTFKRIRFRGKNTSVNEERRRRRVLETLGACPAVGLTRDGPGRPRRTENGRPRRRVLPHRGGVGYPRAVRSLRPSAGRPDFPEHEASDGSIRWTCCVRHQPWVRPPDPLGGGDQPDVSGGPGHDPVPPEPAGRLAQAVATPGDAGVTYLGCRRAGTPRGQCGCRRRGHARVGGPGA